MLKFAKALFPGDRTRMIIIAAIIGVLSGGAIIAFREAVEFVHRLSLGWGAKELGIDRGG